MGRTDAIFHFYKTIVKKFITIVRDLIINLATQCYLNNNNNNDRKEHNQIK